MVRVSRAKFAAKINEEVVTLERPATRQLLQPIDELFIFLVFLSVGLKERDLAHRFNIHQSTVSRIMVGPLPDPCMFRVVTEAYEKGCIEDRPLVTTMNMRADKPLVESAGGQCSVISDACFEIS
ncbi:hypothetical protein F7725_000264 [Dissostichus mawsoni]|uniref:Transposase Helix-turn-helix domain-containing protein n=1 Tax=Dissostichus mawsoni TaxID=36200 RepID=A0A7J5ZG93_DISMA|nr:hypothetical protein F7725_000264 [Dissostichus mawsoni]